MSLFDLNRATLIGNVTKDPQLTYTPKGTAKITFSIATNRSMQNEDGSYRDMPTFHNIVAWGKLAERMGKVLAKGKKVYVEGRIENRSYEKDGQTHRISEVIADNVIVFDRGARGSGSADFNTSDEYGQTSPASEGKNSKNKAVNNTNVDVDEGMENVNPDDIPF